MGCSGSTTTEPLATEIKLKCHDGVQLAAISWEKQLAGDNQNAQSSEDELRILALHGWMDSASSFSYFVPSLISRLSEIVDDDGQTAYIQNCRKIHVVALDLPGHGLSSHRGEEAPPMVRAEYLFYVAEALRLLNWWNSDDDNGLSCTQNGKKCCLLGHSMGAAVSLLYAAAFPEQIRQLILLDNIGSVARPAETTSQHLRKHIQARQQDGPTILKPEHRFYYPSLEAAFKARCRSPSYLPGKQYISDQAARELVERGVVEETDPITNKIRYRFRHDPRLQWSSLQFFSIEQLEALYRDIQCPTCILLAQDGWPIEDEALARVKNVLRPTVLGTGLPGSHHFHADPETADCVVAEVVNFLLIDPSDAKHD